MDRMALKCSWFLSLRTQRNTHTSHRVAPKFSQDIALDWVLSMHKMAPKCSRMLSLQPHRNMHMHIGKNTACCNILATKYSCCCYYDYYYRPDNAKLECIMTTALYDRRIAHVELGQVHSGHILLVVRRFLHLVGES